VSSVAFFPKVKGKFSASDLKDWPVTIGVNEKSRMDGVEFRQYFLNSIVPIFLDSNDVNGKRLMVKGDSRLDRLYENLLVEARTLGSILFPGVTYTGSVIQENDQNYGPIKTEFIKNLSQLPDA
jgi:hypothetical protein